MKITVPTLLVDKKKAIENIKFMSEKAKRHKLIFRPHLKTPQSVQAAKWYKEIGVNKATVSSFRMAEYFAGEGWDDITVAFPVNVLEIDRINSLAEKINLNILFTSHEAVSLLSEKLKFPIGFFIKIDTGMRRSGIEPDNFKMIDDVLNEANRNNKLIFKGFLAHYGHTYKAKSTEEIKSIHEKSLLELKRLKDNYKRNFPDIIVSVGDTPSCSLMDNFDGADEIRPGNFIFYDLQQWRNGSCSLDKIAVAMACPVVAKNEERKEIVIYGGGVHFSKDSFVMENGVTAFGYIVNLNESGWDLPDKKSYVSSLSQEHGIIKASDELFCKAKIGDVVGVLPAHSCMTVNCMGRFHTLEGEELSVMQN
ncbi:MAG: alanine racemase [Bacteroidetes bacterium]|nr:alanine racemase [Bacteroidota bacterium]